MVEAYVWLDAENPKEAMFKARDITQALAGKELAPVLYDIEVCGTEPCELFEIPPGARGVANTSVKL